MLARFTRDVLSEEDEFFREKFGGMSLKLSSFETAYLDRAASELVWQNDSLMAIYRFLINLYWQIKNVFASALPGNMPEWLSDACQRIRNPENLALAGKVPRNMRQGYVVHKPRNAQVFELHPYRIHKRRAPEIRQVAACDFVVFDGRNI